MELRDNFEKNLAKIISGEKLEKAIADHRERMKEIGNVMKGFKKESKEIIDKLAEDADEKRLLFQKELKKVLM